jgi:hypothetical protein
MKTASLRPRGSVAEYGAAVKVAIDRTHHAGYLSSTQAGPIPIRYHESGGLVLEASSPRERESSIILFMSRDAIMAELLEIEGMLQDDRLNDNDRHALLGAQRALRNVLDPETWHQASQTFYRIDNKPSEAVSLLLH